MIPLFYLFLLALFSSPLHAQDFTHVYSPRQGSSYYSDIDMACDDAVSILNDSQSWTMYYTYEHFSSPDRCMGYVYTWNYSLESYVQGSSGIRGYIDTYTYNPSLHDPVILPNLPTTDEYCQGLDPRSLDVPESDLSLLDGQTITSGGCSWQLDDSITMCVPGTGYCHATFEPIGAAPDAPANSADLPEMPSDLDTGWSSAEDTYTPTTDPETFCRFNHVSDGTTTYCYEGATANTGAEYPDGSTRVDHHDGSYTINDGSGGSTSYNPDGTQKEQTSAPTSPGSGPSGDGTEGSEIGLLKKISDGLGGVRSSIVNGFSSLNSAVSDVPGEVVDGLTEEAPDGDAMVGDANLDELTDQMDQEAEEHTDNVIGTLDDIGSDDSSPIADQVTGNFPDLPTSSCTPLTFGQPPFQFTISCDVFEKIRTWFGWILYFWTAVTIMDTFFAPATRRA